MIPLLSLRDLATGQPSSYTSSTRSVVLRSSLSATRWRVIVLLLTTSTLFSVSISPTTSAERSSLSKETSSRATTRASAFELKGDVRTHGGWGCYAPRPLPFFRTSYPEEGAVPRRTRPGCLGHRIAVGQLVRLSSRLPEKESWSPNLLRTPPHDAATKSLRDVLGRERGADCTSPTSGATNPEARTSCVHR